MTVLALHTSTFFYQAMPLQFTPTVLYSDLPSPYGKYPVIYDLLKQKPDLLNKVEQAITYQDPCRLARGEKITEEPRELLKMCGAILEEAKQNRENAICCGAGAGIRSVFPELSIDIAESLLKSIDTKTIATTCPFCTFNLSYASKKKDLEKEIIYFTKIILDSLES